MGNLGTLAMRQGDRQTAQACLEQHLQLVQQLGDWQGEINAWSKMAQLAAAGGEPSAKGGEEAEGGGGENAGGVGIGVGPAGDGNRSGPGGGVAGTMGQDAVARALWCFERAAALAKTHDEASAISFDIDNPPPPCMEWVPTVVDVDVGHPRDTHFLFFQNNLL